MALPSIVSKLERRERWRLRTVREADTQCLVFGFESFIKLENLYAEAVSSCCA